MTPNALTRSLSDTDLRAMTQEALKWRSTGILQGDHLRNFARRLESEANIDTDDTLQIAESLAVAEAAQRFVNR